MDLLTPESSVGCRSIQYSESSLLEVNSVSSSILPSPEVLTDSDPLQEQYHLSLDDFQSYGDSDSEFLPAHNGEFVLF